MCAFCLSEDCLKLGFQECEICRPTAIVYVDRRKREQEFNGYGNHPQTERWVK